MQNKERTLCIEMTDPLKYAIKHRMNGLIITKAINLFNLTLSEIDIVVEYSLKELECSELYIRLSKHGKTCLVSVLDKD